MACVHGCTHVAECAECELPPSKGKFRRVIVNSLNPAIDLSGGWCDHGYRKGFSDCQQERLDQ